MTNQKMNAVVAQSGGVTSAINATLAGVYARAESSANINTVYGALFGIEGIINDRLIPLKFTQTEVDRLKLTPGGYLGSCRYKLPHVDKDSEVYEKIFYVFKKHDIGYFFYIGGNDSMDTANKLASYAKSINYDITIIGLPKTIDNDLAITDHTPGFGSAAKYICASCSELYLDVKSFDIPYVLIVEAMGRNAGWLTASSALVKERYDAPDLIYLPEVDFSVDKFFDDIGNVMKKKKIVFAVISEGIKTADGNYYCENTGELAKDRFGHKILGGSADLLGQHVRYKYGCKVRTVELDLLQRSAGHFVSAVDINESFEIGKAGVIAADEGNTGIMMTFVRGAGAIYTMTIGSCPLSQVANAERKIPLEWINAEGNFVTKECVDYIKPLIQGEIYPHMKDGLPKYMNCDKM